MKGYIIKVTNGNDCWTGTTWMAASWVEYVKVFKTLAAAQRELNQLNEERPGMAKFLTIVEA